MDIITEEEIWRTIENYENYEVSTFGRVRNKKTGRILRVQNRGSYLITALCKKWN